MPEKVARSPVHVQHQPTVKVECEEVSKKDIEPLEGKRFPTSPPRSQTHCYGRASTRRSLEPGPAAGPRHAETFSPGLDSIEPKSSPQVYIPATGKYLDAGAANVKRSTPSASWQGGDKSHASKIPSSSPANNRDLDKASIDQRSPRSHHSAMSATDDASTIYTIDNDIDEEDDPKRHAMWILVRTQFLSIGLGPCKTNEEISQIYLSALSPLVSLIACLYAFMATLLVLVLSPLCLCVTSHPIQVNFQRFLSPPLRLQLRLIYSTFNDVGGEPSSSSSNRIVKLPTMLLLVNLFAAPYAMGICVAAWVAAGFWFFAAILGDPNWKNKTTTTTAITTNTTTGGVDRDDDGRTAVMSVRGWWERWLVRGLR